MALLAWILLSQDVSYNHAYRLTWTRRIERAGRIESSTTMTTALCHDHLASGTHMSWTLKSMTIAWDDRIEVDTEKSVPDWLPLQERIWYLPERTSSVLMRQGKATRDPAFSSPRFGAMIDEILKASLLVDHFARRTSDPFRARESFPVPLILDSAIGRLEMRTERILEEKEHRVRGTAKETAFDSLGSWKGVRASASLRARSRYEIGFERAELEIASTARDEKGPVSIRCAWILEETSRHR